VGADAIAVLSADCVVGVIPVVIGVPGVLAANIFVFGEAGISATGFVVIGACDLGCVLNLTSDGIPSIFLILSFLGCNVYGEN
jgi:hypothetical protein